MRILWAPWRMSYVTKVNKVKCIFCDLDPSKDEENFVIYRGRYAFVILNKYPYNTAHLMIAPYRHVPDTTLLNDQELLEIMKIVNLALEALRSEYKPEGFNIGLNIGKTAGAGIESHVHVHIVPRWAGDTNFMPIISKTKVLPEDLQTTYWRLRKAFAKFST